MLTGYDVQRYGQTTQPMKTESVFLKVLLISTDKKQINVTEMFAWCESDKLANIFRLLRAQ